MSGARKLLAGLGCVAFSMAVSFGAAWLLRGPDHWYDLPVLLWGMVLISAPLIVAGSLLRAWCEQRNR